MTTPEELDKKIEELRQSLINFNKPKDPIQQKVDDLRKTINDIQQNLKPKPRDKIQETIDELRQSLIN